MLVGEDLGLMQLESCAGSGCACGDEDTILPELDVRAIPHAVRRPAIRGALSGLGRGESLVLLSPHNPLSLLAELEEATPGAYHVEYLDRGPYEWRIAFIRR